MRDGDVFRYRGKAGPATSPRYQRVSRPNIAVDAPDAERWRPHALLTRQGREDSRRASRDADYAVHARHAGQSERALLGVPLLSKDEINGRDGRWRAREPGLSPRQMEIVQTFADQAVIAIENAQLFEEVQARTATSPRRCKSRPPPPTC